MARRRPATEYDVRATDRGVRLDRQLRTFQVVRRIASAVTSFGDPHDLAHAVAALVSEGLSIEHVGVFDVDEATRRPSLSAASSEGTRHLLVDRQVLMLNQDPVERASTTGHPQIVHSADATESAPNPLEPPIRFELALPLTVHGRVVGVLDLQSVRADALDQGDMPALSMLADQVGLAIEAKRLAEECYRLDAELRRRLSDEVARDWAVSSGPAGLAYRYTGLGVTALAPGANESPTGGPEIVELPDGLRELRAPIMAGDRVLGSVAFRQSASTQPWGDVELAFVSAICSQIGQALERARLLDYVQTNDEWRRREAHLSECIWFSATDVERVLETALEALGEQFGASGTIRLAGLPNRRGSSGEASEPSTSLHGTGGGIGDERE